MATASDVIKSSGIKFGTSGARGLVKQFTEYTCAAFVTAFIDSIRTKYKFDTVVIGIDRRPSSPIIAKACIGTLKALGLNYEYYGILPTPAVALAATARKAAAIVITGSHIPYDRNGIKFYRPDGEIDKLDEEAILSSNAMVPVFSSEQCDVNSWAEENYIKRYISLYKPNALEGMRIGIYEHSAAGRDISVSILKELGANVIRLGRTDTFIPIDTEAVSEEDQKQAISWSKEYELEAIISTDGDGDRPLVADESGQWLKGDILGLICARELGIEKIAVPVSCNSAIEESNAFQEVVRTRIGSPYVIDAMTELAKEHYSVAGFEANGGFLLGTSVTYQGKPLPGLPTRDAILPALVVMAASKARGKPISQLVSDLPKRFTASDRLKDIPTNISKSLVNEWHSNIDQMKSILELDSAVEKINFIDGLRVTLADERVVHLRPSGNAPELRCYVESDSPASASEMKKHCLSRLDSHISKLL